jgi:hypothetical protein
MGAIRPIRVLRKPSGHLEQKNEWLWAVIFSGVVLYMFLEVKEKTPSVNVSKMQYINIV